MSSTKRNVKTLLAKVSSWAEDPKGIGSIRRMFVTPNEDAHLHMLELRSEFVQRNQMETGRKQQTKSVGSRCQLLI